MPPKRARSDTPQSRKRGRGLSAKQKGQIASYKFNKMYPWSTWGAARLKRGEPGTLAMFGPTYKTANETQRYNRKLLGYRGRGKYTFGSFIRDVESIGRRATKQLAPFTRPIAEAASQLAVRKINGFYFLSQFYYFLEK